MPADLTGTPTSLGIGTYNTSADAPSGLGFNEAMAQIDALLAARATQAALDNLGTPASYTPVWTSDGVQPVLGNGTLTGSYSKVGQLVVAQFELVVGSTTTFGSGNYTFSVPVAALSGVGDIYGGGVTFESGEVNPNQLRWRSDGKMTLNQLALAFVTQGTPITLAAGSLLFGNIAYLSEA